MIEKNEKVRATARKRKRDVQVIKDEPTVAVTLRSVPKRRFSDDKETLLAAR